MTLGRAAGRAMSKLSPQDRCVCHEYRAPSIPKLACSCCALKLLGPSISNKSRSRMPVPVQQATAIRACPGRRVKAAHAGVVCGAAEAAQARVKQALLTGIRVGCLLPDVASLISTPPWLRVYQLRRSQVWRLLITRPRIRTRSLAPTQLLLPSISKPACSGVAAAHVCNHNLATAEGCRVATIDLQGASGRAHAAARPSCC